VDRVYSARARGRRLPRDDDVKMLPTDRGKDDGKKKIKYRLHSFSELMKNVQIPISTDCRWTGDLSGSQWGFLDVGSRVQACTRLGSEYIPVVTRIGFSCFAA